MASPCLHEADGESHVPPSQGPCEVVRFHAPDTTRLCSTPEGNNPQSQWAVPRSYPSQYILLPSENRQQKTNQLSQHQQVPEGATDLKSWGCSSRRLTILTLFWGRIIHISKVTLNVSSLTREALVNMNSFVWNYNYLGSEKEKLAVGFFS